MSTKTKKTGNKEHKTILHKAPHYSQKGAQQKTTLFSNKHEFPDYKPVDHTKTAH